MRKSTKIIFLISCVVSLLVLVFFGTMGAPAIIGLLVFPVAFFVYLGTLLASLFPHKKITIIILAFAFIVFWGSVTFVNACKIDYKVDGNGALHPYISSCSIGNIFN